MTFYLFSLILQPVIFSKKNIISYWHNKAHRLLYD